jgi:putative ABC transport system permease protein
MRRDAASLWFLLRTVSLRRMTEHWPRTILTIVGIALGVAGFIAVQMIVDTLRDSYSRMVDQVAGRVQLQICAGDAGVAESVLAEVQGLPDIAAALPRIQPITRAADGPAAGQSILILGVDTLNDQIARDYQMKDEKNVQISDPLQFLNAKNAVLLSREFAQRNGIKIDDRLDLMTYQGKKTFVVRGLLETEGPTSAFGGNFALMDVYAAQIFFGREKKFDAIDLILKPGRDVDAAMRDINRRLAGRYEATRPEQRTQGVENMRKTFDVGVSILALIVLAMGIFIIINTVMTSVLQRKREIAIQRMLGVTRAGIWTIFSLEGLVFGLVGSVIGIAAGYAFGRQAVLHFVAQISNMFMLVDLSHVSFRARMAAEGLTLGLAISFCASIYPAWRATRITPLETLAFDYGLTAGQGISYRRWLMVLAPAAALILYLLFAPAGFTESGVRVMTIGIFIAAITVTPMFMAALLRAMRQLSGSGFGELLRLAGDNIRRDLGRAGMTVAAFMVGLGVMIEVYLFVTSAKTQIVGWVEDAMTADLVVTTSTRLASREVIPVSPELGAAIEKIPGVEAACAWRLLLTDYDGVRISIDAFDWKKRLNEKRFRFVKGNPDEALRRVVADEAVLISQNLALRHHLQNATEITLDTPKGRHAFPIAGIVMDYASEHGAVVMDHNLYLEYFEDPMVDAFMVYLSPGADLLKTRNAIYQNEMVKQQFSLYVLTNREFKNSVLAVIDQFFALAYSLEALAMIIAFIGIVNNLLTTVVDRTREIGVLRTLGATRGQISVIFVCQAALMAVSGAALSIVTGFSLAKVELTRTTQVIAGWAMPLEFSWPYLCVLLSIAIFTGLLAGIIPAYVAARLPLQEAIKYE